MMRVRIELFTARVDQYRAKIEIERMLWTP